MKIAYSPTDSSGESIGQSCLANEEKRLYDSEQSKAGVLISGHLMTHFQKPPS